jgi:internalin A
MATVKIFLTSSKELETDRRELKIFFQRENHEPKDTDRYLQPVIYEDILDNLSPTVSKDEYNKVIEVCDLIVRKWTSTNFTLSLKAPVNQY